MRALYERIKEARTELHLSQEYVAKFLGVNRTAIVEIESGKWFGALDEADQQEILNLIEFKRMMKERM